MKLYHEVHGNHEVHGTGSPLVLIHGAFGNIAMLGDVLPWLASTRRVIAVDLQGHGRTPDIDRPIRPDTMADDVASLLDDLDIPTADVMGYSLGGGVALHVAIRHPGTVRRLVVVSEAYRRSGWSSKTLAQMDAPTEQLADSMKETEFYQVYGRIAPRPQDWPVLVAKNSEWIKVDYDWSGGAAGIEAPTLLVFGGADAVRPEHPRQFLDLLRDGRLEIIPFENHWGVFHSPLLVPAVTAFLDAA